MTELSSEELERYSRHLVMPEVGLAGQQKLKDARVLCVGAGGLGSPVALYLAAAGIGTLGLVEFDTVALSNIQRQVLYATGDVGRAKVEVADERLRQLNPHISLLLHPLRLDASNAMEVLLGYDIVVDCSDNFATRYLVNDAAVLAGIPNVHASVYRFDGQLSVFDATRGPCYSCLFPEPPPAGLVPSCAEGGVLGMLPGILGSLQALEVVKLVLDCGEPLIGRLLTFDGLHGVFRELQLIKDEHCTVCGTASSVRMPREEIASTCPDAEDRVPTLSAEALHARYQSGQPVNLIDVREPSEIAIARIDGALLIPLDELPAHLAQLDANQDYVVACHKGGRAKRACVLMRRAGIERVSMLEGGIDAWAQRIDPLMHRY